MPVDRAATGRIVATLVLGATGLTEGIDIRGFRSGSVLIPHVWQAADLSFLSSDTDDNAAAMRYANAAADLSQRTPVTYFPVRTAAVAAPLLLLPNIVIDSWMPLPAALFAGGHEFFKAKSTNSASEAVVDQLVNKTLIFRFSA